MSGLVLWILAIGIFLIFAVGILHIMTCERRIMLKILKWLAGITAAGGFLVYLFSYMSVSTGTFGFLIVVLRAIFSTMRMYLMNADYDAFALAVGVQRLQDNVWISIPFWLLHLLSIVAVYAALLSIFGKKLINYIRLRFVGQRLEVYIIKGSDKNALVLGENIATNDDPSGEPDKNRLVIFWINEDDNIKEMEDKVAHFDVIVQALDRKHNHRFYLEKARMGKKKAGKRKFFVILMESKASLADDARDIAAYAGSKIENKKNLELFVFVSSVWDKNKIGRLTRAKKDNERKYPFVFHIYSIADLLVRQMVKEHPPYKCLTFDNGRATRSFTVMILGFGPVGESALLHLIMNGQFTGHKMRAIIIDGNMDNLEDCFIKRYPCLELCCDLEFYNYNVPCEDFYALLDKTPEADFVVTAMNNDELNKRIALDVHRHYRDRRLPYIAVFEKDGVLYKQSKKEKMYIFGCREEVLKYSVIIREEIDDMAKAIHEVYSRVDDDDFIEFLRKLAAKGEKPADDDSSWHMLDWFFQESNRAAADYIPAMLHLVNPEAGDDTAAVDEDTYFDDHNDEDDALLKKTPDDIPKEDTPAGKKPGLLTDDIHLSEVLAETEHLRWNAFHAAMGFNLITIEQMQERFEEKNDLDYARRDTLKQLHACLVSWDDLDKVTEAYNTLAMKTNNEIEQTRNFKDNDRKIVRNIPRFIAAAEKKKAERQSKKN